MAATKQPSRRTAKTAASREPRSTPGPARDERFDEVDRAILDILQHNSKITNADLAERIGMSPPGTLERVRKLEQRGVIRGYVALLDPTVVDKATVAIVAVSLREHGRDQLKRVRQKIEALDDVPAFWHVAGDEDFILEVRVKDMAAYEDFVTNKLSAISGIGRIKTTFVLSTCKDQTAIPLDALTGA